MLWLLHDDSRPADDRCLEALLDAWRNTPTAALLGAKQLDWEGTHLHAVGAYAASHRVTTLVGATVLVLGAGDIGRQAPEARVAHHKDERGVARPVARLQPRGRGRGAAGREGEARLRALPLAGRRRDVERGGRAARSDGGRLHLHASGVGVRGRAVHARRARDSDWHADDLPLTLKARKENNDGTEILRARRPRRAVGGVGV